MFIKKLVLQNHKKIKAGTGKEQLMLLFRPGVNLIQGPNGVGKSTILGELTPFPTDNSNWEEKECMKKIEFYLDNDDSVYRVKYLWHNGKRGEAFFTRNGENMVTKNTFAAVIEALTLQLGLDPNFEALSHLSSYNNKSFALLQPAERKKFLANIVQNLDVYQNIYKTLSKRSSIFKAMVGTLNAKIANLGGNPLNFGELIRTHQLTIDSLMAERETLMSQILAYKKTPEELAEYNENVRLVQELREQYSKLLADSRVKTQRFIDTFHEDITLDLVGKSIAIKENYLEDFNEQYTLLRMEKKDLESAIRSCNDNVYHYSRQLGNLLASEDFKIYQETESEAYQKEYQEALKQVQFNKPDPKDIEFVRDHFDEKTMKTFLELYSRKLEEYSEVSTSIDPKFIEKFCVGNVISQTRVLAEKHRLYWKMFESSAPIKYVGNELVQALDDIDNFILHFNEYSSYLHVFLELTQLLDTFQIPNNFREKYFNPDNDWNLSRENFLEYYDHLTLYIKYDSFLKTHEERKQYRNSGLEISKAIVSNREFIDQNIVQRNQYQDELTRIDEKIEKLRQEIDQLGKAISFLRSLNQLRDTIDSIRDRLELLEQVVKPIPDLYPLQEKVKILDDQLKSENDIIYKLRYSSDLYDEYIHELTALETNYSRIETLKKYCSPSSGIQIIFIDLYINKILEMANSLLSKFFEGKFLIQPFKITDKEFRIPVTKDGFLIDDISSLSTSQMTIVNMCICFAIMMHSSSKMNILRLDEMDAPLDESNSYAFPGLIDTVMTILKCEQAFIITRNEMMDDNDKYTTISIG